MNKNSPSPENSGGHSRWVWFIGGGCLLVILIALLLPREANEQTGNTGPSGVDNPLSAAKSRTAARAHLASRRPTSGTAPAASAEEIVASKVSQFGRNRRDILLAIAHRYQLEVPADVEQFFNAIKEGRLAEIEGLAKALRESLYQSGDLAKLWPPIHEAWGAVQEARKWPAQKLLDYGEAILSSLRPGMVYVGGTDPGRWIPTLLNETSDGERHIVLTQNALADQTYLNYLSFLHGVQMATLTSEDSQRAFQDYIADAQKRLDHDRQFPNEPKQIRPGEDVRIEDGRVQVSGQVAVMAINEKLFDVLLKNNPDLAFAMEESFPFKSIYGSAAPLGPLLELRADGTQNSLSPERAAQSVEYWRATAQQLLADPEAAGSFNTLASWSKMAVGQANLLANDREYISEAEQAYRIASQILPANVEAAFRLSQLMLKTGRTEEANRLLDEFVQKHSNQKAVVEEFRKTHPGF